MIFKLKGRLKERTQAQLLTGLKENCYWRYVLIVAQYVIVSINMSEVRVDKPSGS